MGISTNKAPLVLQAAWQGALDVLKLVATGVLGGCAGLVLGLAALFVWAISVGENQVSSADADPWITFIWLLVFLGMFVGAAAGLLRLVKAGGNSGPSDTRPRAERIRIQVAKAIVASQTGAAFARLEVGLLDGGSLGYGRYARIDDEVDQQLKSLLGDLAVLVTGVDQSEFVLSRRRMKPLLSSIDDRLGEIQVRAALAGDAGEKYLDRGAVLAAAVRLSADALADAPRGLVERLEHEMSRRLHLNSDRFYAIRNEMVLCAERATAARQDDVSLQSHSA